MVRKSFHYVAIDNNLHVTQKKSSLCHRLLVSHFFL